MKVYVVQATYAPAPSPVPSCLSYHLTFENAVKAAQIINDKTGGEYDELGTPLWEYEGAKVVEIEVLE